MRVAYAPEAIRDLQAVKESVVEKFADTNLADEVIIPVEHHLGRSKMLLCPKVLSRDIQINSLEKKSGFHIDKHLYV